MNGRPSSFNHGGVAMRPAASAQHRPTFQPGFAVVDFETTGLSPQSDRVVEVGIVLVDHLGRLQHRWQTRINPGRPMGATHIHGLTDDDVRDAPAFPAVLDHIRNLLQGRAFVAHNAPFDMEFLRMEMGRAAWEVPSVPMLCTLQESQYFLPQLQRRRLQDCCTAVGIPLKRAHSAGDDAEAAAQLLSYYLRPDIGVAPTAWHTGLPLLAHQVSWPQAPLGRAVIPASGPSSMTSGSTGLPSHVVQRIRRDRAKKETASSLLDRVTLSAILSHGVSSASVGYVEMVLEALADDVITDEEYAGLRQIAMSSHLDEDDLARANEAVVAALSDVAVRDLSVATAERNEIKNVLRQLHLPEKQAAKAVKDAYERRYLELSQGLAALPPEWSLGEPLRVGDRVVFTGGEEPRRSEQESAAIKRGVHVSSGVGPSTSLLVTDGSFHGNKAAKAAELGTRTVTPDQFDVLLAYLQPWL